MKIKKVLLGLGMVLWAVLGFLSGLLQRHEAPQSPVTYARRPWWYTGPRP